MKALFKTFTFFSLLVCLSCQIYGDDWVYYYPSAFRPSDGWHLQSGAYQVVEQSTLNSTSGAGCTFAHNSFNLTMSDGVVLQALPPTGWTDQAAKTYVHLAGCSMGPYIFFVFGPCNNNKVCGRPGIKGGISFIVYDTNYTIIYQTDFPNWTAHTKFSTLQCVGHKGSVYLNGDLLYQLGYDATVTNASLVTCTTPSVQYLYKSSRAINSLVYFQNGTAQDLILCDDTPRGVLYCTYGNGNLTDGLYPISALSTPNKTLEVYLIGSVVNNTYLGVLTNYTFYNQSDVDTITIGTHGDQMAQLAKLKLYQEFSASEPYYNFNFTFLKEFEFIPNGKAISLTANYGSIYSSCGFTLDNFNNGHCFNSLSIKLTYAPKYWGCKEAMSYFQAQCCYMYSYDTSSKCYGIAKDTEDYKYECVLLVLVFMQQGSKICTSPTPPVLVEQNVLNNTFVLDQCVNYTIYGHYGYGYIINITDSVSPGTMLADGGLLVQDSSGAIDVFAVDNVYGRQYYKVNLCNDVNEQYVLTGSVVTGKLTSFNCTGCPLLSNQYYQLFSNNTRRKRSLDSQVNVTSCDYVTFGEYCLFPDGTYKYIQSATFDTLFEPLLNVTENILIPDSFNLTVTEEFIQTQMQQIQLNCLQYVCGASVQCRNLFKQYGSVCDNIVSILNGVAQSESQQLISMYSSTLPGQDFNPVYANMSTGGFNLSVLLPTTPQSRSFIEDLLFDKVESVGLPTDQAYLDCMRGWTARDLICAQYYNGIMVLPPIITPAMQVMYTGSFIASMAWGGLTAAGAIPFATQIQARINHLGITQTLLIDNQKMLAESFNNAVKYMQQGFEATSSALQQIQDVVNQQGAVLQEVLNSLNKNFGAVSSVIQDIYKSLDELSANAQMDRLITGRLSALSVLASSKQADQLRVQQQRQLAQDKLNECVLSQSTRNSFCGSGKHVMTIPQTAPNGILFVHFTYTPQTFKNVTAVVGFCVRGNTTDSSYEYALVPVNGRGVFIEINGTYYITSRDMYMPRNITAGDVVTLTSCQANYVYVNRTVVTTFVDDSDFDFDAEFDKWWNETQHDFPQLDEFNYTIPLLNITQQIQDIQDAIQGLNDSYVDLHELSKLTTYIKWPWYIWLAIAFLTIIFFLILGWIFFMTGCCGGCCGCCGLIPLAQRCSKKSSYYQTFDDDVVGERIRPKKNV
ncbi:spike protein [Gammacoronavirus brantae]|uniref:Spike protein n=1 Tax=Canada goose coronavirus TaxID=2569586 RepID=A0A4D6FWE9_9GAMC|nr:spike protein [Canada goose coronavirus]QCB65097.1 spike protein [Canada goose coronavirus]